VGMDSPYAGPGHGTRNTVPSRAFDTPSFAVTATVAPKLAHNPARRRATNATNVDQCVAGTAGTDRIEDAGDPDETMELLWTDLARVVAQAARRLSRISHDSIL
jgi:hypothetical protein